MRRYYRACLALVLCCVMLAGAAATTRAGHVDTLDREQLEALVTDKDRTMVVSVLAAWCGPCREEIPALNTLHDEFKGRVEVVGVSLDFSEDALHAMMHDTKIRFPVYWAGEGGMATLQVTQIPMLIFIKKGREIERVTGLRGLEALRVHFERLAAPAE